MRLLHRQKGAIPYLLLAPGMAWLLVFFVVPMWYLGKMSLSSVPLNGVDVTWTNGKPS